MIVFSNTKLPEDAWGMPNTPLIILFPQLTVCCSLRPRSNVGLFMRPELNSYLSRPKLSWIRTKSNLNNFLPIKAKCTLPYKFLIYQFSSSHERTFVSDIFRWSCKKMETHSDELNWARLRTFHELNSLSLVRLMKWSTTFGLGLRNINRIVVAS